MARLALGARLLSLPAAAAVTLVAGALAALLVAMSPTTAEAHTQLRFADPAPGARVNHPPTQVQLRFFKPTVPDPRTKLTLVGPSGADLAQGPPSVSGLGISQRLAEPHQVGVYVVSYTVVSTDGHVLRGRYDFLLTVAAPASSSGTSPVSRWLWVGSGLVLVLIAGAGLLLLRRRNEAARTQPPPPNRRGR
jgi:copper resistance protein C